jgi:hypothetical protein
MRDNRGTGDGEGEKEGRGLGFGRGFLFRSGAGDDSGSGGGIGYGSCQGHSFGFGASGVVGMERKCAVPGEMIYAIRGSVFWYAFVDQKEYWFTREEAEAALALRLLDD